MAPREALETSVAEVSGGQEQVAPSPTVVVEAAMLLELEGVPQQPEEAA